VSVDFVEEGFSEVLVDLGVLFYSLYLEDLGFGVFG